MAQLATPALALGCANVLFAAAAHREPVAGDGDSLMWISLALLAVCVVLLLSGKSAEHTLERLSWAMVVFIFAFLLVANVLFVPLEVSGRTAAGFLVPRGLPANMDILLLAVFAATAGSGGLGNLAVSNWTRDKGFGMGAVVGSIGGAFSDDKTELAPAGHVKPSGGSTASSTRPRCGRSAAWRGCF